MEIPRILKPSLAGAESVAANFDLFKIRSRPQSAQTNPYASRIPHGTQKDAPISRDASYNLLGNTLGNPVYSNLTVMAGSYADNNGAVKTYPRIDLETVLISVTFPRVVIKTEIQGRNGTVKEYIGEGDPQITITGIICGENGKYPFDAVNQLKDVIKAPVAVDVVSAYLQNLDIHSIVFEDRDFPQDLGGYSYQQFTLNAIGDVPQELRIEGV